MRALDGLCELHLVADQHNISGANAHGDDVGQADLPGFIDEQIVETLVHLRSGKEPSRPRDQAESAIGGAFVVRRVLDGGAALDVLILARGLLHASEPHALPVRRRLDTRQQVVDGLV